LFFRGHIGGDDMVARTGNIQNKNIIKLIANRVRPQLAHETDELARRLLEIVDGHGVACRGHREDQNHADKRDDDQQFD